MISSVRGYGRSLDLVTLMVLLRHRLQEYDRQRLMICFDLEAGFSAWLGAVKPVETKKFETLDSALLAILIGDDQVAGTDD